MSDILLPIETTNRELDAKLLLAAHLVRPGRRALLGSVRRINRLVDLVGSGVYVGNYAFNTAVNRRRVYEPLKRKQFALIYVHEEGGVYPGGEEHWSRVLKRITDLDGVGTLAPDDWICAWGEFQGGFYRNDLPALASRVRVTGHPRFDLYGSPYRQVFQKDADALRARFGRFVLLNTNLTLANNERGLASSFSAEVFYDPADTPRRLQHLQLWEMNMRTLAAVVHLTHRLSAEFPQLNFVLRPHPSESLDVYRKVFRGLPNVHAIHEGPVAPWLMAAEALIHDGCTTAIEATLLNRPVLSLRFERHREMDVAIANELGRPCGSMQEVIDVLRPLASGEVLGATPVPPQAIARRLIANFSGSAVERFSALVEESLARQPGAPGGTLAQLRAHEVAQDLRIGLQRSVRSLRRRLAGQGHQHVMFTPFKASDLGQRVDNLAHATGRALRATRLSSELMALEAK